MPQTIYHIYDKVFKKILTLSSKAVINLINGLFDTSYPLNSTIQYNWTEFEDDKLKKKLADTIVTINGKQSYHMEAQMTKDEAIVFRVFEYGFLHADRSRIIHDNVYELIFPEPKIIYLSPEGSLPDEYVLRLNFGSQGYFNYKVATFQFSQISTEELNQRKMVILIPFKLLKLRKIISKSRSKDNLEALKNLIWHDILGSIEDNLCLGNITELDAQKLKGYVQRLYEHIYSHYEEMEEINNMTDESFMTEIDIIAEKYEQLDELLTEKVNALKEMDNAIREKDSALREKDSALKERDSALKEKNAEISALKERIRQLEIQSSVNK